jgi:hypothetical protein
MDLNFSESLSSNSSAKKSGGTPEDETFSFSNKIQLNLKACPILYSTRLHASCINNSQRSSCETTLLNSQSSEDVQNNSNNTSCLQHIRKQEVVPSLSHLIPYTSRNDASLFSLQKSHTHSYLRSSNDFIETTIDSELLQRSSNETHMKSKRQNCFLDFYSNSNLSINEQQNVATPVAASYPPLFTKVQDHAHHQLKDFKCKNFPAIVPSENVSNKKHTCTNEASIQPHTLRISNTLPQEQKPFSISHGIFYELSHIKIMAPYNILDKNHRNEPSQKYEHAGKEGNPLKFPNDIPICCSNFNVKSLEHNELNSSVFT